MKHASSLPGLKTVRRRAGWLLVLFLVAGSIAYPTPTNWVLDKIHTYAKFNVGQIRTPFTLGLDLQGGTHLEYEADVSKVPTTDRTDALDGVRDVINRRVNSIGVSEPLIQTTRAGDSWRVTVELAGIQDINQAIKLIGETPILEFKEQNDQQTVPLTDEQKKKMDTDNGAAKQRAEAALAQAGNTDFTKLATDITENKTLKAVGGDAGFIHDKAEYADLYAQVKDAPVGVFPKVIEHAGYYTVAKVEEVKNAAEEVQANHILIGYKGAQGDLSTLSKEDALKKIQDLKKQVTPANFEAIAAKESQEPGAADSKGALGWFGKGAMVEPFEKAVFAQQVGTISDVVETQFGYHLIWKRAVRPVKDVRVRLVEFKHLTAADIAPPADPWKSTKLTGRELSSARVEFDQRTGDVQVALQFNDEGAKQFADITKRNVNKPVAIFLDGKIISQPTVRSEILGGQAVITGTGNIDEAKTLARRLQAGALPVPISLIAQQTVGPSLGADSLSRSLKAGLAGFALVALFMILLYRLPGVVSIIALAIYAALSAAIFKLVPVTMTLSGIAGFILSLGIAVDANVLVFERLKEELAEGKTLPQSLEDAFKRAWPSIRDGHVTVLISCAVLYSFSSSIIRGFALTLAVGILLSLFTAVVSARTMLRLLAQTTLAKFDWLFLRSSSRN